MAPYGSRHSGEFLQVLLCAGLDFLDELSALADDDPLLAVGLYIDGGVHEVTVRRFVVIGDLNERRVRDATNYSGPPRRCGSSPKAPARD